MTNSLEIPEELVVDDLPAFTAKVADFRQAGSAGMHVIFDFDRTLTVKRPGSDDEVTTWHILQEHLPEPGRRQYQKLFKKYRALEQSGDMTSQDAITWWSSILDLFVEHSIDLSVVEDDFLNRASIRPGAADLFKLCADNGIPAVILSAGIREVIDIWCRKYNIQPSLVISTALVLDDNNKVIGWQKETLVHVLNKSEANHPELLDIRSRRPHTLVVGDGLDDAAMASGEQGIMRIRVLDPRADELDSTAEQRKTLERFDALIRSGSLQPLHELLTQTVAPNPVE
jgi:HAD superfamily phosphoserine phosphatase-like hydrolase